MKQQHILITKGQINKYVLLPGDPKRISAFKPFLKKTKVISENREFVLMNGIYNNVPVSILSTGIGCPSTAIAAEEAINAGAQVLIRTGTCGGSWRKEIQAGSLIIPTASIRDEGTTKEYILPEFPAVADFDVVSALRQAARDTNIPSFVGINRTHDSFYGASESIKKWGSYFSDPRFKTNETPILSSEMEASALFVIASLRGVKAGAILAVDASPEPLKDRLKGTKLAVKTYDNETIRDKTVSTMIRTALNAVTIMEATPVLT